MRAPAATRLEPPESENEAVNRHGQCEFVVNVVVGAGVVAVVVAVVVCGGSGGVSVLLDVGCSSFAVIVFKL